MIRSRFLHRLFGGKDNSYCRFSKCAVCAAWRDITTKAVMNQPHIQVFQALIYNGGFAIERTLVWNAIAIGVQGQMRNLENDGWKGHKDKRFAEERALKWSKFTGWEIVDAGRVPQYDDHDRNDKRPNRA